jgi:DNA-directed RNA polymerase subunit RPC12/RpoP
MNFVAVQVYTNYIDAHIARGQLEDNGINTWLRDEHTITIDPILTNALGGIKLMVPEKDAEAAIAILNEFATAKKTFVTCPQCGGNNVEFVSTPRKLSNWISAFSSFTLGDMAIAPDKVYHCFDCGKEFELKNDE